MSYKSVTMCLSCGTVGEYPLCTGCMKAYEKGALENEFKDLVNHPPHYTQGSIECIEAIKAALSPEEFRGYCKGAALKYIWRERHKGGVESLAKAQWYIDRLLTLY